MAYKDFTNSDKTKSLMNLTGYSKNDIIYCSSKVIDAAQKVAQAGGGAHMTAMVQAAQAIASSLDPLNASYYNFIGRYFALLDPGFFAIGYANITDEERECMKALFWFESQLMQGIDQQNVSWVNTSVIAPANSSGSNGSNNSSSNGNNSSGNNSSANGNGNGNGNGEDNPFYKQTWFVALGSIIGLSAIGFIGYSIFKPRQIAQF